LADAYPDRPDTNSFPCEPDIRTDLGLYLAGVRRLLQGDLVGVPEAGISELNGWPACAPVNAPSAAPA